jgi:hypothetical protein
MGPRVDPVHPDVALPARVGAAIIGGGIVGACAALFLAQRGVPVASCEKGQVGGEQASRNWGRVRKMGRDRHDLPLVMCRLPRQVWVGVHPRERGQDGDGGTIIKNIPALWSKRT